MSAQMRKNYFCSDFFAKMDGDMCGNVANRSVGFMKVTHLFQHVSATRDLSVPIRVRQIFVVGMRHEVVKKNCGLRELICQNLVPHLKNKNKKHSKLPNNNFHKIDSKKNAPFQAP